MSMSIVGVLVKALLDNGVPLWETVLIVGGFVLSLVLLGVAIGVAQEIRSTKETASKAQSSPTDITQRPYDSGSELKGCLLLFRLICLLPVIIVWEYLHKALGPTRCERVTCLSHPKAAPIHGEVSSSDVTNAVNDADSLTIR